MQSLDRGLDTKLPEGPDQWPGYCSKGPNASLRGQKWAKFGQERSNMIKNSAKAQYG